MTVRFNNLLSLMLTKNSCNLGRLTFSRGFLSALVLALFSPASVQAQTGCSDPWAINCGAADGACDLSTFDWQEGVDYLEGTEVLSDLVYDSGELGTGIPDTLLGTFSAGQISGFIGVIRRNAAGTYPQFANGAYEVPAGYSPTSTGSSTLSSFATWNMIGFIDLGSYTFADLNVELLVDLDGAASTPLVDFASIELSNLMEGEAASLNSFATNQNPASSFFEAFIPADWVPFNPELQGEYGIGLRVSNACSEILFEETLLLNVSAPVEGCDQAAACNYAPSGYTLGNPAICDFISCLSLGCTNENACNYDPAALFDDGSCDFTSCLPVGCTNPAACNYDPTAFIEDGTCDFTSCAGCVDPAASNYDPSALLDDGNCQYPGCLNPYACNYDADANESDGSCEYLTCVECGVVDACNYVPDALIYDNTTCTYATTGYDCDGNCLADADGDGVCDANEIAGCTDNAADNYNASATDDDGSCTYSIAGCMNPLACNFNAEAAENDGSCEFASCVGCTNETACNYDPAATAADNSSCVYPVAGYDCAGNCLSDLDFDGVCDDFEQLGCSDATALNFDPTATELDGSCEYEAVCNDATACNEDAYEAFCLQVEVYEEHTGMVGGADLTGMTTYRIYALCENPTDALSSVAGDDEFPTYIHSTGDVFQSEFGGAFAQDISPALIGFFPELAYDTWMTIGLEGPASAGEGEVTPVEGLTPWTENFEQTGTLAIQDEVGGAMFTLGAPSNSVAGADLRVLIGQFTTNGTLTGQVYMQFFPEGNNEAAFYKFVNLNEACMLPSDAGCEYAEAEYDCDGNCLEDADADGICDAFEVVGCTDVLACNFDATATDSGDCTYPEEHYDCSGNCLMDTDGDGVCDAFEIEGCTAVSACNYDPAATNNDGSCEFAAFAYDCDGNCLSDFDGDGVCDGLEILGCTDGEACNFEPGTTENDGSCVYPEPEYDCNGNCLVDSDGDGVCDALEVLGCTDEMACNYDALATEADDSCIYAQPEYDCEGNCLIDSDGDGVCDALEINGCDDSTACNFDAAATENDGTCSYAEEGYDCAGICHVDTDGDGICDEFEIPGCLDAAACNFNPSASDEDGTCSYAAPGYDCDGNCLTDIDGDGVCDPFEIEGCDDAEACNFNEEATENDGSCEFPVDEFDCNGNCLFDADADGVCDAFEVPGCNDAEACNFDPSATDNDESCTYAETGYDCAGTCLTDTDGDGICDEFEIAGCTDTGACNYNPEATDSDAICTYPETGYDCDGNCLEDADGDGICDEFEVSGCTDLAACNYEAAATDDDGSCSYPETGYDCAGNCLADEDADGICDEFEIPGCDDEIACNYDAEATDNDGSCVYADAEYDCDGNCLVDSDGDGICDTFEIPGCSDPTACNFNPAATDEDGSCVYAEPELDCEGNCIEDTDNDGICNAFEILGCTDETALNYNPDATDDDGSCEADPCNPDVTPPFFTYVPADSTITCDQPMPTGMAMAMDECGEVSVTFIDGPIEYVLPCPPFNYFCTRTFTATDASGNTADTIQYITVVDTIGPAFIYTPADTVYVDEAAGDLIPVPEVAVEDACDLMAGWDSEDFIVSSVNDTTTIERVFTASDQCGNENTWTQIIIVYEATFGCTEEGACNYDPAATADDDSCFYAGEGYDCDGNCLEDSDGDGICDPFEVEGCTAMNACNYNSEATNDDGSCDYCSCAEGIVGNYGLEIEVVAEHETGDLAGMTTYRFWVTTESPNDFVSSIYGSNQDTLKLTTTAGWYNTDLGGDFGQNINASLFDLFPELEYDSWLTIGLEQSVNSVAGEQEVTTLGPPTGGWLADFSAGQNVEINDEVGGAWFILNGASNGVAGDDLKVLVAQLTTDGDISGTLNAQIFGEGIGANDLRFHFNFEGTQWVNNGGLTNNCGCTDSEAYNYDSEADYDNGECAFCALDFASIDVTDVSCFGAADGAITVTTSGASTDSVLFTFIPGGPDGLDSTWTPIDAGSYEIQILDGNGCSAYSTFEVTEPEELVLTIDNVTDQTEDEVNGAIEISVTGGTPEYNFDWMGLSGTFASENEDIDGLVAGEYGVTVTDANGCSITSDDISIEVVIGVGEWLNAAVQLYPNPTSDVFTLEFPAAIAAEGCTLLIHDAAGRLIASRQIPAGTMRETVDVLDWSAGIYTIQITTIEHASTSRMQVQH